MKVICLILSLLISQSANSEQTEFIDNVMRKVDLEMEIFSYDGIHQGGDTKRTLKMLGNCKKIDFDNWNFKCEGKKTYLIASKEGSVSRFRVIEKMSLENLNAFAEKITLKYGPPDITKRHTTRPFQGVNDNVNDSKWDATLPVNFTWYQKPHPDCCLDSFEGNELNIKYWYGEMLLTVSDESIEFYKEEKFQGLDKLILSYKTSFMLGFSYAFKGILFLMMVLIFKFLIKSESEIHQYKFGGMLGLTVKSLATSAVVIFIFQKPFGQLSWMLMGINIWGLAVSILIASFAALYMSWKKI